MRERLDGLLEDLGARATGYWSVTSTGLRLVAFRAAVDMAAEVRDGFTEATRSIPLDRCDLSIVRAALEARPVVARATEWDAASGSGYWLRAFGAQRSVAVPLADAEGQVAAVLSVALPPSCTEADATVVERVRDATRRL